MHNAPPDVISELAIRLTGQQEVLLMTATAQIIESIPVYGLVVPRDDLIASGRAVIEAVVGSLVSPVGGSSSQSAGPATNLKHIGRRRLHQGVPLEEVLRAIRLDFTVLWAAFAKEAQDEVDPVEILTAAGMRLWGALDATMLHLTDGYRSEEAALDRVQKVQRRRALAELFDQTDPSAATLARASDATGFDTEAQFLVAVGRLPGELAETLDGRWRSLDAGSYVDTHGSDTVALTVWSGSALRVLSIVTTGHLIVTGRPVDGLKSVPAAVRLARAAVHGTPERRVGQFKPCQLIVEAVTAEAIDLAQPLASQLLEPLNTASVGEASRLLETLRAWADTDGSTSAVAELIHVHRNTVANRLGRIQELTGLSLRRPGDVAELIVALRTLDQGS